MGQTRLPGSLRRMQEYFGVQVGEMMLRDDFARILHKYGAKVYLNRGMAAYRPLRFVVDGGIEGLVMPYQPPSQKGSCNGTSSSSSCVPSSRTPA